MVPCAVTPYSLVKRVLNQMAVPTLPTRIRTSTQFLSPTLGHHPPSVVSISEAGYQCFGATQAHLLREHGGSILFRNPGTHLGRCGKRQVWQPRRVQFILQPAVYVCPDFHAFNKPGNVILVLYTATHHTGLPSTRPLRAEAPVRGQASPCAICALTSSTRTRSPPRMSVSSKEYHFTSALRSFIHPSTTDAIQSTPLTASLNNIHTRLNVITLP